MKYCFVFKKGKKQSKYQLSIGQQIYLGRVSQYKGIENEIIDDDSSVNKLHAIIRYGKKGLSIMDKQTKNGTFVNGVEIEKRKRVLIENGDEIKLGDSENKIVVQEIDRNQQEEQSEEQNEQRERSREKQKKPILSASTIKLLHGMKGKPKAQIVKFLKLMGHKNIQNDWQWIEMQIKQSKNKQFQKINNDLSEQFQKVTKNKKKFKL